jgi:hypothetical protein
MHDYYVDKMMWMILRRRIRRKNLIENKNRFYLNKYFSSLG